MIGNLISRYGSTVNLSVLSSAQYGFLVKWRIDDQGCFVNDEKVKNSPVYKDLKIEEKSDLRIRIGVAPNAKNKGGLNLFGKHYGDFEQDIVLKWL